MFRNTANSVQPEAPFRCLAYVRNSHQSNMLRGNSASGISSGFTKPLGLLTHSPDPKMVRSSAFKFVPSKFPTRVEPNDSPADSNMMMVKS